MTSTYCFCEGFNILFFLGFYQGLQGKFIRQAVDQSRNPTEEVKSRQAGKSTTTTTTTTWGQMDGQTHTEASGHCSQTEKSTTPDRQTDRQRQTDGQGILVKNAQPQNRGDISVWKLIQIFYNNKATSSQRIITKMLEISSSLPPTPSRNPTFNSLHSLVSWKAAYMSQYFSTCR